MIPKDPLWFWWPVTFAIITACVATHIAGVARRNSMPRGKLQALGAIAVLTAAIPIVPLTIGMGTSCSDTGLELDINIYGIMGAFPALVLWSAVLWRLYLLAGGDSRNVERYPLIIFLAPFPGMVLELPLSMISMSVYCDGSWTEAQFHLVTAGLAAVGVGCAVSAVMRLHDRQKKSAMVGPSGDR